MLTTIIYRSHICEDVPVKALEDMVAAANCRNRQFDVTGILLFNGTHFFQLLEGPAENVKEIYELICRDPRHHNVVELLSDHGPSRRFGNVAVEILDRDKTRLALQQASQTVAVDAQGNAELSFYANYIATADNPQPGRADADATFMINYN